MARRNRAKPSSLFLLELTFAILFFSMASAICIQLFVKSHLLSKNAWERNIAVTEISNVAELINVSDDIQSATDLIKAQYPESERMCASGLEIYYNKSFKSCKKQNAVYCLSASFTEDEFMLTGKLKMYHLQDSSSIYSLNILHHLQRRSSHGNE